MMSKAVTPSTGGYEKKDKTVILQESTPMHRTITPAPLTVKQRTK